MKVGIVALDGTKIQAHAALASNRTVETITAEVSRMLTEAQATDTAEDRQYGSERCGDELPEALRDRTSRLTRLRACQERLEREAADATAQQQAKIETRRAKEAATGQKKRGRKPKAAKTAADGTAKANVTDPDSRIMKTQAAYVQGYNAQASEIAAGMSPSFASESENVASCAAKAMSQQATRPTPPPNAEPWTRAMVGLPSM